MNNELFIVSTPIGNLEDISLRALRILREVDVIACEDTRETGKLFKLLKLPKKQLFAYHDHNELKSSEDLIDIINAGKKVALVCDAGTPLISDPGYRIVKKAIENDIKVIPIPGPSSITAALVVSGLPSDQFHFYGFPPQKKGRKSFIEKISNQPSTSIILESPYRIEKLIKELLELCNNDRKISICRELTKFHEEKIYGTLSEVSTEIKNMTIKGEFVILLEGNKVSN